MAGRSGPAEPVFHVFAAGRDVPGAAVSVSGGNLVRAGDGKTMAEGCAGRANCANDDLARRGDLRLRTAVPVAGIYRRLGMGAEERPAARGCAEYDRVVDDAVGCGR